MQPTRPRPQTPYALMRPYELSQIFSMLARLKTRLCVAVDEDLQREHHLPLESFDAMKVIAGFAEGCDPDHLADSLAVDPQDADVIIDALVATGHAFRKPSAGANGAAPVALTLAGALLLRRAGRTVERVLRAQLDPMLSPSDQGLLQESLRALRLRNTCRATDTVGDPASSGVPC